MFCGEFNEDDDVGAGGFVIEEGALEYSVTEDCETADEG